jgi:hypothetical protein
MAEVMSGVVHRTPQDEEADTQQTMQNFDNRTWMAWPNKGAVGSNFWTPGIAALARP